MMCECSQLFYRALSGKWIISSMCDRIMILLIKRHLSTELDVLFIIQMPIESTSCFKSFLF